jgi:HK97 family phage major capsid protein
MSTTTVLERLCSERDEARNAAIAIAETDGFNPEDPTYVALEAEASSLDARVGALHSLIEARSAADAFDGKMAKAVRRQEDRQAQPVETRPTWGEAFVRSEIFTSYGMRGTSSRLEIDDDVQTRALPTGLADLIAAGFKGAPTQVDTTPPTAPTPLMDNIAQIPVSTNAIEYIAWTKKAGGATKVAEKAAKPSAEFAPTVTPATLDNFAVYTQLTRQMIEDQAAVAAKINGELRNDVLKAEEADAVAVLAAATAAIPDVVNADLLKSIRMGVGTVQAAGYAPNAVLLNPADWASLDIGVMGGTLGGPTVGANFWGLRPIPSSAQAAGTAIVGDFRSAVEHYFRSQVSLYVTDSHGDTFLSNVFTLLAERRGKTVVVRPAALVEAKTA